MLNSDWHFLIDQIEALLLARKQSQVAIEVKKLVAKKPPREALAPLAAISRRAGFPYLALSILQPIFRNDGRQILSPPSRYESFVYGSVLVVLGAKTEGLNLLEKIDSNEQPDVLLFQANSKISDWQYQNAKPLLEKFLSFDNLKPLQRLVGNLNLCSCYIVLGKPQKFKRLLKESYRLADDTGASHLKLSIVELESQFYFYQKEYLKTQSVIKKYYPNPIEKPATIFEALLRKWDLLSLAKLHSKQGSDNTIVKSIKDFALYSKENKYWEIYRDCDFHYGLLSGKKEYVYRAYYGSPSQDYRKNLLQQLKNQIEIPNQWVNSKNIDNTEFINRTEATLGSKQLTDPYSRSWNLFYLLTQDLYKPVSLARLFNDLFPGEYFVKSLSAHRIQQQIGELRNILQSQNLNFDLNIEKSTYHLIDTLPILYDSEDVLVRNSNEYYYHLLKRKFENYFTANEVQTIFNISRTKALDFLNSMIAQGRLIKISRGRETIYQFKKSGNVNL